MWLSALKYISHTAQRARSTEAGRRHSEEQRLRLRCWQSSLIPPRPPRQAATQPDPPLATEKIKEQESDIGLRGKRERGRDKLDSTRKIKVQKKKGIGRIQ